MKEQKNCQCLDTLRQAIITNSKDSERPIIGVIYDLANIGRLDGKGMYKTAQKIWITEIHTMKKSGEKREKERVSFLTHNYCPFCGTKFA